MKEIKKPWIFIVLISFSLCIHAQTQIGNDIDGLLASDKFGTSVSISLDGNIVAIVGFSGTTGDGRIRVFENIGGAWTLYGTDINGENFGGIGAFSVSLSADGNTLAFGGLLGLDVVKVFSYNTDTGFWTQKGNDIPNNTSEGVFGFSIKLSSDGNTLVIGAVSSPIVPAAGVTQIFQFETGSWNQVGDDINGVEFGEHSGRSVDISSDGKTVAILNNNSARVYKNISGAWTLFGDEIPALGSQYPNSAVSLSSNGDILAIGEPDYTDSFIQQGRVRVFSHGSGTWNQVGRDINGEVAYYRTGASVSLSSDGQILAIGEPGSTSGSTDRGRTRLFENQGSSWVHIGNDIFGEASEDYSGGSISLSSDASTLAIGAYLNDGNGVDAGHARIYDLRATLYVNDFIQPKISLFPNPVANILTIDSEIPLTKVEIYSMLGKKLKEINSDFNAIPTNNLSNGVYIFKIYSENGMATKKLIKK